MSESPSTKQKNDNDVFIVDCDVHVQESPAALAPYCAQPWRRSLEYLSTFSKSGGYYPHFTAMGSLLLDPPFPDGLPFRTVETPDQMREGLDMLKIDVGILFPDNLLGIAMLPKADYALALARAYNEWLLDKWLDNKYGLKAAVVAVPQAPEASARDIERYVKEANVAGVYLPAAGVEPLYGHRMYDPIYQAAQDADVPVMLHGVERIFPVFPANLHKFENSISRHVLAHTFSMMANMVSMFDTGVMVRFPRLQVVFTEAGVSWVPFLMYKLDKEFTERRRELPFLEERPSEYIKRFYFATQPIEEPEPLRDLVSLFKLFDGENNVVFASDWPHHDFDHPSKILQAPFSPEAKRKIMGGNAARLFKMQVPEGA